MGTSPPSSISTRRISIQPLSLVWFPKECVLAENTHVPRNRESYTLHITISLHTAASDLFRYAVHFVKHLIMRRILIAKCIEAVEQL